MSTIVQYEMNDRIATLTMDDGKVNCIGHAMVEALNAALDRAEADKAVVVLTGRQGVFSAGFDLKAFQGPPEGMVKLLRDGANLLVRLLSFPTPILVASTGHALAMGSFLTLAGDTRIGLQGGHRYGMNEVTIGLTLPHFAVAIARHRLGPAHFDRAANTAKIYDPDGAVNAGFLDFTVEASQFSKAVHEEATRLAELNMDAHRGTKARVRAGVIQAMLDGIATEFAG